MTWKRCTAERYDEMLGCLPPKRMEMYGFLVGEPSSHRMCKAKTAFNVVRADYAAFAHIDGQHYEGPNMTVPEWDELSADTVLREAAIAAGWYLDPVISKWRHPRAAGVALCDTPRWVRYAMEDCPQTFEATPCQTP